MSYAEVLIDRYDRQIVEKYYPHVDLIEALDQWILAPDRMLLPRLQQLAELVKVLQPKSIPNTIYRGMDVRSTYQEHLGLSKRGIIFSTPKDIAVGSVQRFMSPSACISFTSDLEIARAFGKTVVSMDLKHYRGKVLVITDELSQAA